MQAFVSNLGPGNASALRGCWCFDCLYNKGDPDFWFKRSIAASAAPFYEYYFDTKNNAMRARSTSATVCVMCDASRRSAIRAASVAARLRRRSARASSITPVSEDSRPPLNAAMTFLRETDGRLKLS